MRGDVTGSDGARSEGAGQPIEGTSAPSPSHPPAYASTWQHQDKDVVCASPVASAAVAAVRVAPTRRLLLLSLGQSSEGSGTDSEYEPGWWCASPTHPA